LLKLLLYYVFLSSFSWLETLKLLKLLNKQLILKVTTGVCFVNLERW